jgi:hypothetical protein
MNNTVFINILYTRLFLRLSDISFYFSSPAASHFLSIVQNNLIKSIAVAITKIKKTEGSYSTPSTARAAHHPSSSSDSTTPRLIWSIHIVDNSSTFKPSLNVSASSGTMLCWCCGAFRVAAGCARESITRSVGAGARAGDDVVVAAKRVASSS